MAQKGQQVKVGAQEGFPFNSVKLVLLANGNWFIATHFFLAVKRLIHIKFYSAPALTFLRHACICSLWHGRENHGVWMEVKSCTYPERKVESGTPLNEAHPLRPYFDLAEETYKLHPPLFRNPTCRFILKHNMD
jgi:hypothetical protein